MKDSMLRNLEAGLKDSVLRNLEAGLKDMLRSLEAGLKDTQQSGDRIEGLRAHESGGLTQ